MFTREYRDLWVARLLDPKSKQKRNGFADWEESPDKSDIHMCCLAHGEFAINGELCSEDKKFDIFRDIPRMVVQELIKMNDDKKLSLPEIAEYVKTIPVSPDSGK